MESQKHAGAESMQDDQNCGKLEACKNPKIVRMQGENDRQGETRS